MHKSFTFSFSFIIILLIVSACDNNKFQWQKIDNQAIKDAKNLSNDAHQSYLQCYPIDQQNKRECVHSLNDQYIKTEYKANLQYQKSFQYKTEKLGFLQFLKDHNLPCFGIDYGPKFIGADNAYQVDCNCGHRYQMQFDRNSDKWQLKN